MSKWENFKKSLVTLKAQAIVHGLTTGIWIGIATTTPLDAMRFLAALNAAIFGALAGSKISDHFNQKIVESKDFLNDKQHELIMSMLEERQEWLEELERSRAKELANGN